MNMKLSLYNKKRDFKKTPEPKGKVSHQHKNLYVIQKHAASHLHYDFRIELNGVLLSWAVPKGPCLDPSVKRLAMHVEDHPVEYGHFEGMIPEGEYGGGTVMLWDIGKWVPLDENPTAAYHQGHLKFELQGKKLKGSWHLINFKREDKKSWFLIKGKDKYVKPFPDYDITLKKSKSVLTNYSIDEITQHHEKVWTKKGAVNVKEVNEKKKQKNPVKFSTLPENIKKIAKAASMPAHLSPQLATLIDSPPAGDQWLHELKFDGYRIIAFKQGNKIRLMSRNNREWTAYFPNVIAALKKLAVKNIIVDGEIVLLNKNQRPDFQLLQNAIGSNHTENFLYYIFDLLYLEQYKLFGLPLLQRKEILQQVIPSNDPALQYSNHIIGNGMAIFEKSCEMGFEGIIAKKIDSTYEEKRSKTWLKVKCTQRQEFVIGGYSPPKRSRSYFGSLYLGYYDHDTLKFCGNVGTGFNTSALKSIYDQLQQHRSEINPFHVRPPGVTTAIWVKPVLVAEVEFSEWTSEGILRHPSFKGLRSDKPARVITREKPKSITAVKKKQANKVNTKKKNNLTFKLTNPSKILYPEDGITKLQIAEYYAEIANWIMPYIVNRPLTLVRCPDNYKKCFYQKHINRSTPATLYGLAIKEKEKTEHSIYIKDREGLMALVQMGTLEIHPWGSRIEQVEYPDTIIIDLDPAPDIKWQKVVATAKLIKDYLQSFKLKSYIKTTGGKGLHVAIPLRPEYDWETVKNFTHVFVKFLVANHPKDYIGEMSKVKREGKIFVDYLRNQRGATAIGAYSTRARAGAPVSVPLEWDELTNNFADTFYTIATLPQRLRELKRDPWHDFHNIKQSLNLDKLKG